MLALILLPGCKSTQILQPRLDASIAPAYQGASIQVDLVGVNNSELATWNAKPIDDYFAAGDAFRASASKVTFQFGDSQPAVQSLPVTDKAWQQWKAKGASHVVVIADLPGYTLPMGGVDLRRQIIPLQSDKWEKSPPVITVEVSPTGILLVPAPKIQ
jgi:hypothetical protein